MSTTTTAPASQYKATLSCNHVIEVGPETRVGHRVAKCDKCQAKTPNLRTRTRAVKAIREVPTGKLVDGAVVWSGPVATDTGMEHGPFRSLVREAAAQPEASRAVRAAAARTEHAALTAWVKGGRKGPQPATPNLDALQADNVPGTAASRPRRQPAQPRQPRTVVFTINGHVLNKSNQVVSSLAWQATKGLGADGGRLTTTQLRELLAAEGLTDLESGPWSFTLANGKVIGAQPKEA